MSLIEESWCRGLGGKECLLGGGGGEVVLLSRKEERRREVRGERRPGGCFFLVEKW